MGLILIYLLGVALTAFGYYYYDYRQVAGKQWCTDPHAFVGQYLPFYVLFGIFWPFILAATIVFGPIVLFAVGFGKVLGYVFGYIAAWLSKKGL